MARDWKPAQFSSRWDSLNKVQFICTVEFYVASMKEATIKRRGHSYTRGFPAGSEVKASACNAGDLGSIPGSGRSPGEENGNPLQYSCLENPMDGGAWWATVHRVAKSWTRLNDFTSLHSYMDNERKISEIYS